LLTLLNDFPQISQVIEAIELYRSVCQNTTAQCKKQHKNDYNDENNSLYRFRKTQMRQSKKLNQRLKMGNFQEWKSFPLVSFVVSTRYFCQVLLIVYNGISENRCTCLQQTRSPFKASLQQQILWRQRWNWLAGLQSHLQWCSSCSKTWSPSKDVLF